MKTILIILLASYAIVDVIGTIYLIIKARRNPFVRKQIILAFKFLVGAARITDDQCPYPAGHSCQCQEEQGKTPQEDQESEEEQLSDDDEEESYTEQNPLQ